MKKKKKSKLKKIVHILSIFIVAFCISQAGGWASVEATILYSQTTHTYTLDNSCSGNDVVRLGTGLSGTIRKVIVSQNISGTTLVPQYIMTITRNDTGYSGGTVNYTDDETFATNGILLSDGADQLVTYNFTGSNAVILNPAKYYTITFNQINTGGTATHTAEGINSNVNPFTPFCAGSSADDYYLVINDGTINGELAENNILISTPTPNQNFNTPYSVTFSGSYNYNSASSSFPYDKIGFEVTNIGQLQVTQFDPLTLVDGTPTNWSFAGTATTNSNYSFRAYFYDSTDDTVPYLYSDLRYFSTDTGGGTVPLTGNPNEICTGTVGALYLDAIPCYLRNFAIWLFVPSTPSVNNFKSLTLEHTFPFSYIYDIGTAYDELFANGGSMEYAVSVNTGALGTISFISASQISAVPYASTIKTILGYLLWFYTGMFLYRLLLKAHD